MSGAGSYAVIKEATNPPGSPKVLNSRVLGQGTLLYSPQAAGGGAFQTLTSSSAMQAHCAPPSPCDTSKLKSEMQLQHSPMKSRLAKQASSSMGRYFLQCMGMCCLPHSRPGLNQVFSMCRLISLAASEIGDGAVVVTAVSASGRRLPPELPYQLIILLLVGADVSCHPL